MNNKGNKSTKQIYFAIFGLVVIIIISFIFLYSSKQKSANENQTENMIITEAEDSEENIKQRDALFAHLGYVSDDYEIVNSKCTNGKLYQWWYKNKLDNSLGVYVAIGDIQKNDGIGYPEFDEGDILIQGDENYELEISVGSLGEDGYMEENENMRSYYFVQGNGDIEFVNLIETE